MVKEDEPLLECKLLKPEEPLPSRVELLVVVRGLKCTESDPIDPLRGADWVNWVELRGWLFLPVFFSDV